MKTKDELNALKEEVENMSKKLNELSEEEMEQVSGGNGNGYAASQWKDLLLFILNTSNITGSDGAVTPGDTKCGVTPSSKTLATKFEVTTK